MVMVHNIILAGASGEVGQRLLSKLIARNDVTRIYLINREPQDVSSSKVVQYQVDFKLPISLNINSNIDQAYCCLGSTIKQAGSKTAFEQVDYHYVLNFAKFCQQVHCPSFAVISSIGAHPHKGGFYLKTKGRMEEALINMNWPSLFLFRPSLLMGKRKAFRLGERLGAMSSKFISPFLTGPLRQFRPIEMDQIATALSAVLDENEKGVKIILGEQMFDMAKPSLEKKGL